MYYRDPSRPLEGHAMESSESLSRVFSEFFRNFLREVTAVLGVWPTIQRLRDALRLVAETNLKLLLRVDLESSFERLNFFGDEPQRPLLETKGFCVSIKMDWVRYNSP